MKYLIIALLIISFSGCATADEPVTEEEVFPDWVYNPPVEEGYFYGVGTGLSLEAARQLALVNTGHQFRTQICSVIEHRCIENGTDNRELVVKIDEQFTDHTIIGTKFHDQYLDNTRRYWVLARAPLNCVLDVTESVLISYKAELKSDNIEIIDIVTEVETSVEKAAQTYEVLAVTPKMVFIEGGKFRMGSARDEDSEERPVHSVTVDSFWMGKYEVTQAEWSYVMGINPSARNKGIGDDYPVNYVNWFDAVNFCNRLSLREGLTPCYTIDYHDVQCNFEADGYRLPTEAEWEYAARGGNKKRGYKYAGSNNASAVAWFWETSGERFLSGDWSWPKVNANNCQNHPVGSKKANELGLYDMSGNAVEWCWDWNGEYTSAPQTNPTGPESGEYRVSRGGGWHDVDYYVRVSARYLKAKASTKCDHYGLRLVRSM